MIALGKQSKNIVLMGDLGIGQKELADITRKLDAK
jgi:hypothetical protein